MPEITLTRPQTKFLTSLRKPLAQFILFIGGFGSGKSETLVVAAMSDIFDYPGANVGVYSPTYDLMRLILLPRFEAYLREMGIRYRLNKTEWVMDIDGYGMLIFRSLDKENRIIGYEHYSAHIDELDTLPMLKAEGAWLKILGRNRQVPPGFRIIGEESNKVMVDPNGVETRNKIGIYTTPEGFNFTFKYFSESGEAYRKMTPEAKAMYQYVRAPTRSNPHLPPGYVDTLLATYPAHLINAYLLGQWVNLNSGRVYPLFSKEANACSTIELPGEDIHVGMDFNVQRGCAAAHVLRLNNVTGREEAHRIFEIYNAYDTPAQAKILKERFGDKGHRVIIYPDAAGNQRRSSNASTSDFAILKDSQFGFLVKEYNYNGSIKDRVNAYNARICDGNNHRSYFVNIDECPNSVVSLETQVYDINGLPEKGPGKWDDLNDSGGYFMVRKYPLVKPKSTTTIVKSGTH